MSLTAIMVEDERASRETLRHYLTQYCPSVQLLAEATNVTEGLAAIRQHQPLLVFLDVEMPYGNAFDLLEQVGLPSFETIFVTAYSHYAIKALNFSASYYLLKPLDIDELVAAVDKVHTARAQAQPSLSTQVLLENLQIPQLQQRKVVLPVLDGLEVVRACEIVRCQANGNFTDIYLADGSQKMICRPLRHYETLLEDAGFLRVHKSHLVNLDCVTAYKKGKGGRLLLTGGHEVEVSAQRKGDLLSRLGG
jgi:two-component system LytT family response regulator